MDIRKLQRAIVDGLEDVKAQQIAVFNTEHLSSMFERVIIASGTSNRQTKALAASVRNSVKGRGMQVMATEGEDNGEWIIVDCGAAVAHIMQPAIREYYHLEEIWGGKPVRITKGDTPTRLVKASEPEPEPAAKAARKSAGKTASKTTAKASGAAAGSKTAPAKKRAPAKSSAARQADAEQKTANRTAAFKRVAKKAAPAGRETRAPASKTIVVKPPGKPAAKSAAKPAPRSAAKPGAKPAAKPSVKTAAKPVAKRPAAKTAAAAKKAPARKAPLRG